MYNKILIKKCTLSQSIKIYLYNCHLTFFRLILIISNNLLVMYYYSPITIIIIPNITFYGSKQNTQTH